MTRDEILCHVAICAVTCNRIDLSGANLSGANLSGANLSGANLIEAYLIEVDLSGANLSGAYLIEAYLIEAYLIEVDLSGANLSGASLRGANLSDCVGIVCLNVIDPRGYRPVAVDHGTHWMIASGCRWMTADDALAYCGADDYHTPALGQAYCQAIRELPAKGAME